MARKVYTCYQTNQPNILGGFMTYSTLADAWAQLGKTFDGGKKTVNEIRAVTRVDANWWHGKYTGYLYETLSSGVIFRL